MTFINWVVHSNYHCAIKVQVTRFCILFLRKVWNYLGPNNLKEENRMKIPLPLPKLQTAEVSVFEAPFRFSRAA